MPARRNRRHILVPYGPHVEAYRPHGKPIPAKPIPPPKDRLQHAEALTRALWSAWQEAEATRQAAAGSGLTVRGATRGLYVEFYSQPGVDLKLESLEDRGKGIEVTAVRGARLEPESPIIQRATVFVPDGALKYFFRRFEQYASEQTVKGEPRHRDMIDRIAMLRRATLRALWTDAEEAYPADDQAIWWEVWLRRQDGEEIERFQAFSQQAGIRLGIRRLAFDDRVVVLAWATPQQMSLSLDVLGDIAEVRKAKETAAFFADMPAAEQADWAKDLVSRTIPPPPAAPAVCVLDTGVARQHPLLAPATAPTDLHAVDNAWGAHDHHGHGTEMAGLALYGDLTEPLVNSQPVALSHRLESVKILPPVGHNAPDLYGAITAEAVALPEITAPDRRRVFSMAITSNDQRDRGRPTSWSAAIDALAAGRAFDQTSKGLVYLNESGNDFRRLFVVSAGNVPEDRLDLDHLDRSDLETVQDPAQAWNALTVGAYTEKAVIADASFNGWLPVSPPGELSPWSTTSVIFHDDCPIKPEVVFEGGNLAHNGSDLTWPVPDLSLLTTYYKPHEKPFVLSWATSAATAQVARIAAVVQADYPEFWPETVRALIVHAARWTPVMEEHLRSASGKRERARLLRRYGYGVPSLERALRSANDTLTLIVQGVIHPFANGRMREMHCYELPWPKEVLEELGEVPVRLRVTLSYFVEPNPARRGWRGRYRYASHGLRFDVKLPTEKSDAFRKRLNQQALAEEEEKPKAPGATEGWFLGEHARNKGSLHCDIWEGTAVELARRGVIAVYPISGWWKHLPHRDRSDVGARYSLVVGIEVEAEEVDIWTPVAAQVGVPVESIPLGA